MEKNEELPTLNTLTDSDKKKIIEQSIQGAGQILRLASYLTNANEFITGVCIYPDGTTWDLEFKKRK